MAQEPMLIKPTPPPSNAPKYYYPPQLYYVPEPYHTTAIPKHHHFDQHSHIPPALDSARQAIGHAFHAIEKELVHPYGDYPLPTPNTDIRESRSAYYIDVELPGIQDKRDVVLKWTALTTLYLEANIKRQPTPEEFEAQKQDGPVSRPQSPSPERASEESTEGQDGKKKHSKREKPVHTIKRERRVGRFARAFAFPVAVDQEKVTAKLAYGILSITVPKKVETADPEHKHVDIDHAGH
jgi:HSP20 family molecular chaperone IbpA